MTYSWQTPLLNNVFYNMCTLSSSLVVEICRIYHSVRIAVLIIDLRPANRRRRYKVTSSLIGWGQTWNQPCIDCAWKASPITEAALLPVKWLHCQETHFIRSTQHCSATHIGTLYTRNPTLLIIEWDDVLPLIISKTCASREVHRARIVFDQRVFLSS